jgi:hypothetical protein
MNDHRLIQSIGLANKENVVDLRVAEKSHPTRRSNERTFQAETPPADGMQPEKYHEFTVHSELWLEAVAVLDPEAGFVSERVWSVSGRGAYPVRRLGLVRLLASDDSPDLGGSGQCAPPGAELPSLARWMALEPS